MENAITEKPLTREERFVQDVITRCQKDKGLAAKLRRADNPATEYQSWELLVYYGIDLEKPYERLPYITIGAAIAKAKIEQCGTLTLGEALAKSFDDGNASDQAKMRLRRLLACDDVTEACRHLRPILTLIQSRLTAPLNYQRLLKQLRRFAFDAQKIKIEWAQEFYGNQQQVEEA